MKMFDEVMKLILQMYQVNPKVQDTCCFLVIPAYGQSRYGYLLDYELNFLFPLAFLPTEVLPVIFFAGIKPPETLKGFF